MTDFEILMFGVFIGMIFTIIMILCIVCHGGNDEVSDNDKNDSEDTNKDVRTGNRSRNVDLSNTIGLCECDNRYCKFYENGELNNIVTISVLENIKRELFYKLSNMEKDAIDKAIKNTLSVEKLKAFIDCGNRNDEW